MRLGTVAQVWRYPVKSMVGEQIEGARLDGSGVPGDRGWAVVDVERGGVTSAKRLPALRACHARYLSEPANGETAPVEVTLPDGETITTDDPDAGQHLSAAVGRRLTLASIGPEGADTAPRLTSANDSPDLRRELMGLAPGEPEPDLSAFSAERLAVLRRGNFFDAMPVHLLSTTTLETLARLAPASDWDARRFRMNLLVELEAHSGFPELGLVGRRLRVGSAVLEIADGCPRCVMVTQAFDALPRDPRIMRTLVRSAAHTAGVYATVVEPGAAGPGADVSLV